MSKFTEGVKRVLNNNGKIEIINKKEEKLNIDEEVLNLINNLEFLEKENFSLKSQIESFKKNSSYYTRAKKFIEEFKIRKTILELNDDFKTLTKLHQGKRIDKYIYDSQLKDSEIILIELFEMMEKLKI